MKKMKRGKKSISKPKTLRDRYISVMKFLTALIVISFMGTSFSAVGLTVYADLNDGGVVPDVNVAGGSDTNTKSVNGSLTFEADLVKGGTYEATFLSDWSDMRNGDNVQKNIANNFKSASEYNKWYKKAIKYIAYEGDSSSGVVFYAKPQLTSDMDESKEADAWSTYGSTVNSIDRVLARGSVSDLVDDTYATDEFDPSNAFVYTLIESFKRIMQSLFKNTSQVLMALFIGQTGLDAIYMAIPGTGCVLARAANGSSGGGRGAMGGGAGSGSSILTFNIVSEEAVEAVNGSTSGGTGAMRGNSGSGGGFLADNKLIVYGKLRFPLILLVATYVVLVSTGIWARLIAALSSVVASAVYSVV